MAFELDHEVGDELRGAGGLVVGQPDQALVLGLEQIVPALGSFELHAAELILVDHEAEQAGVNAVPVAVGVLVDVLGQVGGVHGHVGIVQEALGSQAVIGVVGAAEPHVGRGISVLFLDLGGNLAGGQALVGGLDAVELLEVLAGRGEVVLLAGAVDNDLALGLGRGDQIIHAVRIRGALAEHAQREDHGQDEHERQCLFHIIPPINILYLSAGAVKSFNSLTFSTKRIIHPCLFNVNHALKIQIAAISFLSLSFKNSIKNL
jgi:hypothetical protein